MMTMVKICRSENKFENVIKSLFQGSQDKLTIFNSDLKVLVWTWRQLSVQSTSVAPRVRLGQVCDAHLQKWRWFIHFSFVSNVVSASLSSVASCLNENVFFFTFVLTEDLPASRKREEGTRMGDVSSYLFSENGNSSINESNVSIPQICWKDDQTLVTKMLQSD